MFNPCSPCCECCSLTATTLWMQFFTEGIDANLICYAKTTLTYSGVTKQWTGSTTLDGISYNFAMTCVGPFYVVSISIGSLLIQKDRLNQVSFNGRNPDVLWNCNCFQNGVNVFVSGGGLPVSAYLVSSSDYDYLVDPTIVPQCLWGQCNNPPDTLTASFTLIIDDDSSDCLASAAATLTGGAAGACNQDWTGESDPSGPFDLTLSFLMDGNNGIGPYRGSIDGTHYVEVDFATFSCTPFNAEFFDVPYQGCTYNVTVTA